VKVEIIHPQVKAAKDLGDVAFAKKFIIMIIAVVGYPSTNSSVRPQMLLTGMVFTYLMHMKIGKSFLPYLSNFMYCSRK